MTTTTTRTIATPLTAAPAVSELRWALHDALAVTRRNLIRLVRQPQLVVFSTIQPVMFVLLFNYVFGGSIQVPNGNYTDYLMPGIFVQTVAFGATQTAVGLAEDLAGGMIDRFRSLPMARSAVLIGRTVSDLLRNIFVILLMTSVGYLIGFRRGGSWTAAIAALLIVAALGFALSWIYVYLGLSAPSAETAQAMAFVVTFPLVFASSAFTPVERMPGWLQAFARATPITNTVNAARALTLGTPATRPVVYSLAWILSILVVFIPLATARFRRSQ
jgi:ABC-2 type transport system permease protein/oleandomycin transport system permease protein